MNLSDEFLNLKILIRKDGFYQRNHTWKNYYDKWIVDNEELWRSFTSQYSCEDEAWYFICHPNSKPENFVCEQCGKIVPYSVWCKHNEKHPVYLCSENCRNKHKVLSYFKTTGVINPGQLRKLPEKIYYENHLSEFVCENCGKQLDFQYRNNKLCRSCKYKKNHEDLVNKYYKNPKLCECCRKPISFENRHSNKTCSPDCSKKLNVKKNKETMIKKYGVEHPLQLEEFKNKAKQTCLKKYGVENASSSNIVREKVINTCMERYGVKCVTKLKNVTEKSKQTLMNKYGVNCSFSINKDSKVKKSINTKMKKYGTLTMCSHRFEYNGIKFDSKDELYFYVYNRDILKNDIKRGDIFEYIFNGRNHKYFCDFKVNGENIEIKGGHLVDENGLRFPYVSQSKVNPILKQKQYNAKYECMKNNNVKIVSTKSDEMCKIISIVDERYGKDYIKSFDVELKQNKNQLFEV